MRPTVSPQAVKPVTSTAHGCGTCVYCTEDVLRLDPSHREASVAKLEGQGLQASLSLPIVIVSLTAVFDSSGLAAEFSYSSASFPKATFELIRPEVPLIYVKSFDDGV